MQICPPSWGRYSSIQYTASGPLFHLMERTDRLKNSCVPPLSAARSPLRRFSGAFPSTTGAENVPHLALGHSAPLPRRGPGAAPLVPRQHPDFPFFSPICGTITITDGASDGTNLVAGARNLRPRRTAPRERRRLGVLGARVERLSRSCRPRSPARPKAAQNRRARLAPPAAPAAPNPGRGRVLRVRGARRRAQRPGVVRMRHV